MTVLIIKGATSTDELAPLGLYFAQRYADAEHVILVDDRGQSRQVKGITETLAVVDLVELEAPLSILAAQARRLKETYERMHPTTPELAHSFVGIWLFYFGLNESQGHTTIDYAEAGDVERIRRSADDFISSDFGRAPIGSLSPDGGKAPDPKQSVDGPEAIDTAAARVLGDGGSGDDLPADS
jgi:hypothetical protein